MNRVIAISLSPNAQTSDIFLSLKLLFSPWEYKKEKYLKNLTDWFKNHFSSRYVYSYSSGRAGLFEILKALGIKNGDEVILQAFTCVALPNAILAVSARPVYVDILVNTTMDPKDFEKKITEKTKAVILQHTFGIPADIDKILTIAKKHKLTVIEDCAHGIGISYKNKFLGQFGDVSFFSFGRDKAFSSVFGGMVITNDASLGEKLTSQYKNLAMPSYFWIMQQLFHPVAFAIITPLYDFFSLGKVITVFFQKLHLLSFPVSESEKKGLYMISDTKKLPEPLAALALAQLQKMKEYNTKREDIALEYIDKLTKYKDNFIETRKLPYLRFSFLSENRDMVIKKARKQHIYLGKWYGGAIDPAGVDGKKIGYIPGSCPMAEKIASSIVNLPTYPLMTNTDVKRVIDAVSV